VRDEDGNILVYSANTAFTYKGKHVDLKQVGRELNVRYVLEGSVQRSRNRLRVNVQLIDAETGTHLWAERFDKPVADFFDMQDGTTMERRGALLFSNAETSGAGVASAPVLTAPCVAPQ